jgi:hypothetical protein
MDDKTKKVSKLRSNLRASLAGAVLRMASNIGIGHSCRETEREFIKREPIFQESANGSGDPPWLQELSGSAGDNYIMEPQDYMSTYFLTSAHVEKTGDRLKITVFDSNDREISYQ